MLTYSLDLGQLVIALLLTCVSIIAWFIKKELSGFGTRLDKHESVINNMTSNLATVVGQVSVLLKIFGDQGIHVH